MAEDDFAIINELIDLPEVEASRVEEEQIRD